MKISSEVREHWTQYLQGQLTADDHDALGRRLVAEPDLASALAADANVHQLLLDHFATKPALIAVLSSLPERSFGKLSDAQFFARCLEAVGPTTSVAIANSETSPRPEMTDVPAAMLVSDVGPPVFDLNGGITFEEPNSIPPIAIEPPPVCNTNTASGEPVRGSVNRWVLIASIAATALLTAAGTWWVLQGQAFLAGGIASAENDREASPPKPGAQFDDPVARAAAQFDPERNLNPVEQVGDVAKENNDANPRQPAVGEAAVDAEPMLAQDPNRERFPQVIRGGAEEPNFIKDHGEEMPTGPVHTKIPVGQLVAGRDALWEAEPGAWGIQPMRNGNPASRVARSIRLTQGAAQLVLDNGMKVGMQAPAAFQFVSPTELRLIDGMFLVEPASAEASLDWTIETDCFEVAPSTQTRFFVTTSADFGTGFEILEGEGRLMPEVGLGEPMLLGNDGFFSGHFLPTVADTNTKPGAAALAHRDGSFLGQVVAFETPLLISSSDVFGATLQTVVKRMREAPADFEGDWSRVVKQLEQLNSKKRNRPGLRHEVKYAGDLLPAFPELQADLGRGIPLPKGPFDMEQIRQFAGQININGQLINLDNLNDLRKIQQDLANDLAQLRAEQERMQRNRNRRNAADPDFMAQQLLVQQMQQIEMILKMAQGFQNGNLPGMPGMMPGEAPVVPTEPVVASFSNLLTPEGQQDRAAMIAQLQQVLEESLEDDAQRAERLKHLREKLHQQ